MKQRRKINIKINPMIKRSAAAIMTLIFFVTIFSNRRLIAKPLSEITDKIGSLAVAIAMPEGSLTDGASDSAGYDITEPEMSDSVDSTANNTAPTASKTTQKATEKTERAIAANSDYSGKISAETIGYSGANLSVSNLHVQNNTGLNVDLSKQLKILPDIAIYKNRGKEKPQVLIIHTHATECYYPERSGGYKSSWPTKSTDDKKNMISVGNEFARVLNDAGISTIHDTTQYDKEAYSGSYERARVKTKEWLKKYPSIDVVIDLHRDSITYDSGTKLRPEVTVNGKSAAQIMICTGSNSGKVEGYDNWLSNFRFAIRLQQSCEKKYKNLARPLYFVSKKYNHDLCNGSLLIEVGSEANTLEQAKYSARLTALAMIDALKPVTK